MSGKFTGPKQTRGIPPSWRETWDLTIPLHQDKSSPYQEIHSSSSALKQLGNFLLLPYKLNLSIAQFLQVPLFSQARRKSFCWAAILSKYPSISSTWAFNTTAISWAVLGHVSSWHFRLHNSWRSTAKMSPPIASESDPLWQRLLLPLRLSSLWCLIELYRLQGEKKQPLHALGSELFSTTHLESLHLHMRL